MLGEIGLMTLAAIRCVEQNAPKVQQIAQKWRDQKRGGELGFEEDAEEAPVKDRRNRKKEPIDFKL